MEPNRDKDLAKIKELLRHTGEFIAYFELVDSKMSQWQHDLEEQAKTQQLRSQEQFQNLHQEIESLQESLTQAGLAKLRIHAEQSLQHSQHHLDALKQLSKHIVQDLEHQKLAILEAHQQHVQHMENKTQALITKMDSHFNAYDAGQFHRIAHETTEHIKQQSKTSMMNSASMLKTLQWRSAAIAVATTFITAFVIGLYASSEMPWETHQHARNEREAGRVLLNAWPTLSKEEKTKILGASHKQRS